jgi:hypothetical protein
MAHEVDFEIPSRALGRADVTFTVRVDGSVFGTLKISNGSLVWFPKKTTNGSKMDWQRFHRMMEDHSTEIETR